jgi:hypothetical protein
LGGWRWRIGGAVALSGRWRRSAGVRGEGLCNQFEGEGGGGRATRSTTSSMGDDGGPAATMSTDTPMPFAATAAAIDGEVPVPTPDHIAGVDVTILVTWLQIQRERGRRAWLTRQLERLNATIKTYGGCKGC